jgi:hypothetical protein
MGCEAPAAPICLSPLIQMKRKSHTDFTGG